MLCVGFLTGGLRPAAILAGGLFMLVSGAAVSLGEIAGQRFRSRFMLLSEPLVHEGYLIRVQGCRAVGFVAPVVGRP